MGRRVVLLVAAGLVAAMGAGLVFLYVGTNGSASASDATLSVYTATAQIDPGTKGSALTQANVVVKSVPADSVPAGAITSLGAVSTQTAVTTVFPGQVLISSQFGENNATGGLPIPPGTLGVSIQLNDPQRVAGFVQPGSKIAIFKTENGNTSLLLTNITVIAVGPSTMSTKTQQANGQTSSEQVSMALLTLALTPAQSAKVINGTTTAQLHLGLIGKN